MRVFANTRNHGEKTYGLVSTMFLCSFRSDVKIVDEMISDPQILGMDVMVVTRTAVDDPVRELFLV